MSIEEDLKFEKYLMNLHNIIDGKKIIRTYSTCINTSSTKTPLWWQRFVTIKNIMAIRLARWWAGGGAESWPARTPTRTCACPGMCAKRMRKSMLGLRVRVTLRNLDTWAPQETDDTLRLTWPQLYQGTDDTVALHDDSVVLELFLILENRLGHVSLILKLNE